MGIFKVNNSNSERDRDADRQLAASKRSTWWSGRSSRAAGRPENAGLSRREIDALERENNGGREGRRIAVSGRAGRAQAGGNHRR